MYIAALLTAIKQVLGREKIKEVLAEYKKILESYDEFDKGYTRRHLWKMMSRALTKRSILVMQRCPQPYN